MNIDHEQQPVASPDSHQEKFQMNKQTQATHQLTKPASFKSFLKRFPNSVLSTIWK